MCYNSFLQLINFHGFFRNALRCQKTGACRILVPLRYNMILHHNFPCPFLYNVSYRHIFCLFEKKCSLDENLPTYLFTLISLNNYINHKLHGRDLAKQRMSYFDLFQVFSFLDSLSHSLSSVKISAFKFISILRKLHLDFSNIPRLIQGKTTYLDLCGFAKIFASQIDIRCSAVLTTSHLSFRFFWQSNVSSLCNMAEQRNYLANRNANAEDTLFCHITAAQNAEDTLFCQITGAAQNDARRD